MSSGLSLTTLLAIGALSLLPLLLMVTTSFVKISVVLSLLRNALGVPDVPSGAVVTALAMILSAYVMTPVAREMAQRAAPASARIDIDNPLAPESRKAVLQAFELGTPPLAAFLRRNAGSKERALFLDLARRARPADQRDEVSASDLSVAIPAFLVSELAQAFRVGLLVLLPFVVIDLVVASILLALGMSALPPATIALPFKLLLFVLVDGFFVLSKALVSSYG
ncbi:MAG: EscR/YscR/HrcR family type III secretion system export apparatus protein [Polyangiales bacterium]